MQVSRHLEFCLETGDDEWKRMGNYKKDAQERCIEVAEVFFLGSETMQAFTTQANTFPISMSIYRS
jgi:hypothetical protein